MRHHFVPQFLLSRWAANTPDKKVEVFRMDLLRLKSSRLGTKHTAYEDDLYALSQSQVAGMEKQAVEKNFLRLVDEDGARVLRKLEQTGLVGLQPRDREDWARFLMSLRIRQPQIVSQLRMDAAEGLRQSLKSKPEEYQRLTGEKDPPTLEDWAESKFPGLIENFGMTFFHELIDNRNVVTKILRMKWWLWDFATTKFELVLADHPCVFEGWMILHYLSRYQ